jgi:hypothetical protein
MITFGKGVEIMQTRTWLGGAVASIAALLCEPVFAGVSVVNPIPTLDEYALFGLTAAVGVAGLVALIRRRK